jgi:DNA-binding HxlR family transcriptional regulator
MARVSRSSSYAASPRSRCPISCALDLLGDRWTLLVIRDLFGGKSRYGEFATSAEGIPTNILADRLERLEASGLVTSEPYQENPRRYAYTLTPKGRDLRPVLGALGAWALRHVPRTHADAAMLTALRGNS